LSLLYLHATWDPLEPPGSAIMSSSQYDVDRKDETRSKDEGGLLCLTA
jgi:hypothetical protein